MNSVDRLTSILSLIAAVLMASGPVLPDTAPGSQRAVVVAVAGVILALVQLVRVLTVAHLRILIVSRIEPLLMEASRQLRQRMGLTPIPPGD